MNLSQARSNDLEEVEERAPLDRNHEKVVRLSRREGEEEGGGAGEEERTSLEHGGSGRPGVAVLKVEKYILITNNFLPA